MATATAATTQVEEMAPKAAPRIKSSNPIYGDILDFLYDEAALLDDDRFSDWLAGVADDITYRMPVRKTLYRCDGKGFDERTNHWFDNKPSLEARVQRAASISSALERDPAPRMRRVVSNLVVHETETAGEYAATSYLLLMRSRFEAVHYDMLTAKREDIIRRSDDGACKLARRLILVDQSALGATYHNVFM
jgi:3-phenylpropionate/cinnamic acid dioxygenase small subunit